MFSSSLRISASSIEENEGKSEVYSTGLLDNISY